MAGEKTWRERRSFSRAVMIAARAIPTNMMMKAMARPMGEIGV